MQLKGNANILIFSVNSSNFPVLEDFLGYVNFLQVSRIKLVSMVWVAWTCGCVYHTVQNNAVSQ